MKIAIAGHQSYGDRLGFYKRLDEMHRVREISGIIITYTSGPCKFAKEWCERNGVHLSQMVFDRATDYRNSIRAHNTEIVDSMRPDIVITVGQNYSAKDLLRRARAAGIDIVEIRVG